MRSTRHVRLRIEELDAWAASMSSAERRALCPWQGDATGATVAVELYENWVRIHGWQLRSVAVSNYSVYDFVLVGESLTDPRPKL